MGLKFEVSERTKGANAIEFTREIMKELFFTSKVKGSRVVYVCKSDYGFWRWKEAGRLSKERCEPGDWIVIDGTDVSFKTQGQYEAAAYGEMVPPDLDQVIIY